MTLTHIIAAVLLWIGGFLIGFCVGVNWEEWSSKLKRKD